MALVDFFFFFCYTVLGKYLESATDKKNWSNGLDWAKQPHNPTRRIDLTVWIERSGPLKWRFRTTCPISCWWAFAARLGPTTEGDVLISTWQWVLELWIGNTWKMRIGWEVRKEWGGPKRAMCFCFFKGSA